MFETLFLRRVTRLQGRSLLQRPVCLLCRNLGHNSHSSQLDEKTEQLYKAICRGERAALGKILYSNLILISLTTEIMIRSYIGSTINDSLYQNWFGGLHRSGVWGSGKQAAATRLELTGDSSSLTFRQQAREQAALDGASGPVTEDDFQDLQNHYFLSKTIAFFCQHLIS